MIELAQNWRKLAQTGATDPAGAGRFRGSVRRLHTPPLRGVCAIELAQTGATPIQPRKQHGPRRQNWRTNWRKTGAHEAPRRQRGIPGVGSRPAGVCDGGGGGMSEWTETYLFPANFLGATRLERPRTQNHTSRPNGGVSGPEMRFSGVQL